MNDVYIKIGEFMSLSGGIAMFMGIVSKLINIMLGAFTRGRIDV